mmetsp:Transcript_22442/g.29106  ORF Transcript_22442/g.29106 Transcript_22442/m.29106 type:complete len:1028 (+) Transcript_22442:106-3189(+)
MRKEHHFSLPLGIIIIYCLYYFLPTSLALLNPTPVSFHKVRTRSIILKSHNDICDGRLHMSGTTGLSPTQQRAFQKSLGFQRFDSFSTKSQNSYSSVSGSSQKPVGQPPLQQFASTSAALSVVVGGVAAFQRVRKLWPQRGLSTRLNFSPTPSLLERKSRGTTSALVQQQQQPQPTQSSLFQSGTAAKKIGLKQIHIRGLYAGLVTATQMVYDANTEDFSSDEISEQDVDFSEENFEDFQMDIAEFEAADGGNEEFYEEDESEDTSGSDDVNFEEVDESAAGDDDEMGNADEGYDDSADSPMGGDMDEEGDSEGGAVGGGIDGPSEDEIREQRVEMMAKLESMWGLGEDGNTEVPSAEDFEDDEDESSAPSGPVKLRDTLGRYERLRPQTAEERYQEIEKIPDEELAQAAPLKVFSGDIDENEAIAISKILMNLDQDALMSSKNYPYVQLTELDNELLRMVQGASAGTRGRALEQVFRWASGELGSRRAAWSLRAAGSVLFPENYLQLDDYEAACTQGVLEGLRTSGDAVVFQNLYNNQERRVWELGAWAEYLYSHHLPQINSLSDEHKTQIDLAVATYYDLYDYKIREQWKGNVHTMMFKNCISTLLTPGLGLKSTYDNCMSSSVPKLKQNLRLILKETDPTEKEAVYWLEVRGRRLLQDLLLRAAQQADPNVPNDPAEQMSPWQIVDIALDIGRSMMELFWKLDYPEERYTYRSLWKECLRNHLIATAPELTRSVAFFGEYAGYFVQTALMGKRDLSGLNRFDLDMLIVAMNVNPVRVNGLVEFAYPAALAQTIYRQKDKRELTDCIRPLELAFEIDAMDGLIYREKALGTVVSRLQKRKDPNVEEIADWAGEFLKITSPKPKGATAEVSADGSGSVMEKIKIEKFSRKVDQVITSASDFATAVQDIRKMISEDFEGKESEAINAIEPILSKRLTVFLKGAATGYMQRQVNTGATNLVQAAGLVTDLIMPILTDCGVEDAVAWLHAKDLINENEEYNISELCWELSDAGKEVESVQLVMKILGMK